MSGALVNYSFLAFIIASFTYTLYNFVKREKLNKALGYAGSLLLLAGLIM
ncbi:MAG: hypothetical protein HQ583_06760, partial [Candidatus Abyssubacteria bacterium]|nr:hypothetical protein [Candidatus Abyssubacteria bacterium]